MLNRIRRSPQSNQLYMIKSEGSEQEQDGKKFIGGKIPADIYEEVAKLAAEEVRSVRAQVEVLLDEALKARGKV